MLARLRAWQVLPHCVVIPAMLRSTNLLLSLISKISQRGARTAGLLVILAVFTMLPSVVNASVVYSKTGIGTPFTLAYNQYNPNSGSIFWVSDTAVDKLRIKTLDGQCPIFSSVSYPFIYTLQGNFYLSSGVQNQIGFCDMSFLINSNGGQTATTTIPIGTSFYALYIQSRDVVLSFDGSISNGGTTSNFGTNVFYSNGGLAFALCSNSNCGVGIGSPAPPADGIASQSQPFPQNYAQNPVPFVGTYNNGLNYDKIEIALSNTTQGMALLPLYSSIPLVNGVGLVYSFSKNLPFQGAYTGKIRLFDSVTASTTPWVMLQSFGLGTTTISVDSPLGFIPQNCNLLDVGCGVRNAFGWAFYPSPEAVAQFKNLSLNDKIPFSYLYDMKLVFKELFSSSASSTMNISVGNLKFVPNQNSQITFISSAMISSVPYSGFIRTILGYMIWFSFALLVYRQVYRIHDK